MTVARIILVSLMLMTVARAGPTTKSATIQGMLLNGAIRFDVPSNGKSLNVRAKEEL